MNQQAEDAITWMLNEFGQTNQDYQVRLLTLGKLLEEQSDLAIIEAAKRFAAGDVEGQSMTFPPTGPEFVAEARKRQELIDLMAKPRLPAPRYFPGPLAPFQVRQQKRLAENAHLPVLFENITYDQWRKMSAAKEIPVGAKWIATLGIVYGPAPKQQAAAE
ncbi:hypothetical protein [Mesorhizobium sp. ESP-6-2]|uniref:hypothetical protein n=1 Tax=Mesorhizobium sp. ESP-6-2 TaxID=2876625 RepID=UPI001CCB7375|nr:hypothetical protein [Mesorhizobium sp. ESP-6-2]MBZ9807674.1 hypothetical protein [Mesorhizobium sp. ESP-6-2]